jgi:Holliday junction resolvase-like predicted endonuclease
MNQVKKRDGNHELFKASKLCSSLENAGVESGLSKQICGIVKESISANVSTEDIFRLTRRYLADTDPGLAAIYSLDRGLSALGPSGFLFEQYVGAMFEELGYIVDTNYYAQGEAVEHEIDVRAQKGNTVFIVEAKYRNNFKTKTPISQVMYADARIEDIRRKAQQEGDTREYYEWVVTNTQFTENAISYVTKRDIQLLGWDFPSYINLKKIAYEKKLYPVTVLPSITRGVLKKCAQNNFVLVRHLKDYSLHEIQAMFKLDTDSAKKLRDEIQVLLQERKIID